MNHLRRTALGSVAIALTALTCCLDGVSTLDDVFPVDCAVDECEPSPCGMDMALIDDFPGGTFCIDIYEASVTLDGALGSTDQDRDDDGRVADKRVAQAHADSQGVEFDEDPSRPGSGERDPNEAAVVLTTASALSVANVSPTLVSWYQAAAACTNAGKRLCTGTEWSWACQGGTENNVYPYGDVHDGADEAGVDCWTEGLSSGPQTTGSAQGCTTRDGLYDMSGNVYEWTTLSSTAGLLRSGYYAQSASSAACDWNQAVSADTAGAGRGFRCCLLLSSVP